MKFAMETLTKALDRESSVNKKISQVDNYHISKPICLCNVNLVNLIKHINISTNVPTALFQSYFFDCMEQQFATQET